MGPGGFAYGRGPMPIKLSWKLLPLALGGLVATLGMGFVVVYLLTAWWSQPLFGFGAGGPDQPIAFPHVVHVTDAGIQCEFCHRNVVKGEAATLPAVEQCIFCHETITGQGNLEIEKLLAYAGLVLNPEGTPVPSLTPQPINWERVHRLPDHVQFAHEPHVRFFTQVQGMPLQQACSQCHGNVAAMTKVKQVRTLKMGDCVDCHRDNNAPTDCATCHY